ncbi:MAG: GFA family protein [Sphingomonas sp.]|nr:GFA family protein [Sphingomonas sp.]
MGGLMTEWTGGCLCGAVRYRLASDPFDAGWCHCRMCQLFGGSPAMAFATVPQGDFHWTQGAEKVRRFRSTSFGHRTFCNECGTPFLIEVDYQPETIDFAIATLDGPDAVAPGFHIFWSSKVAWFEPGDDLPRFDRFRPDTRGLEGTEPPGD